MTYCFHCATEGHDPADCWVAYTPPTAQRQWVGLTDEEVDNFLKAAWSKGVTPADFIRAIEAKLKEKNERQ
jgi:hypothetical protein